MKTFLCMLVISLPINKSVNFFKNQSLRLEKKFQLTLVSLRIPSEHFN